MAKRIVSSALALILFITSFIFLGVAIINIIEPIIGGIVFLIKYDFSDFGEYILYLLQINTNRAINNPMKLGVPAKLIISDLLFMLAIFVVSYKDSKVWRIIRKVSGIATSAFLLSFALSRVIFALSRCVVWVLYIANLIAHYSYIYNFSLLYGELGYFGSLSFAIFLSLVVAVICVVLAACIMVSIFKKNQTREQALEKKKQAIKKKLSKLQDMQAKNVAYVPSSEEKTEAKTETKVDVDSNGAIIVKFN